MCVVVFAVVGKIALSEDIDVRSLQRKLAAQESRLNDLQAKVNASAYASGGDAEGILSANKNAVLTIGGTLNTKYFYRDGKISSGDGRLRGSFTGGLGVIPIRGGVLSNLVIFDGTNGGHITTNFGDINPADGDYVGYNPNTPKARAQESDLKISHAKLTVKIDVNEYFDAFLKIDFQSSGNVASDNAEEYWIRWKNVCNTGFGLKVGRDLLVFGEPGYGAMINWTRGGGDGISDVVWSSGEGGVLGYGGLAVPLHNVWEIRRLTQISPYWQSRDGKFSAEFSLFQNHAQNQARLSNGSGNPASVYYDGKWKSKNYGTSGSLRLRWRPIEGLLLSASVVNYRNSDDSGTSWRFLGAATTGALVAADWARKKNSAANNTAIDLAFSYRPAFFNKLNVWGQWIHGWNVLGFKDLDSDAVNLGASFNINQRWTIFAQGDYLKSKGYNKSQFTRANVPVTGNLGDLIGGIFGATGAGYDKAAGYALYAGLQYKLPYGVNAEVGYKYEEIKWKNNVLNRVLPGTKVPTAKVTGHTAYAHLGFDF
jgi:hypothetical protein